MTTNFTTFPAPAQKSGPGCHEGNTSIGCVGAQRGENTLTAGIEGGMSRETAYRDASVVGDTGILPVVLSDLNQQSLTFHPCSDQRVQDLASGATVDALQTGALAGSDIAHDRSARSSTPSAPKGNPVPLAETLATPQPSRNHPEAVGLDSTGLAYAPRVQLQENQSRLAEGE